MPGPVFVFAFVIATLMGAIFHFIFGGDARRLALFLLAAWIGFALGHAAGRTFALPIFAPLDVGNLNTVTAISGALFTLISVMIFTADRPQARSSRNTDRKSVV